MKKKSKAKSIALSSVFAVLSVLFLLLSTFMPLTYFWLMAAGLVLAILAEEVEKKYALCGFLVASILSFIFVPSLILSIEFMLFYGLYPTMIQPLIEKRTTQLKMRVLLKALVFMVATGVTFFISTQLIGLNAFAQRMLENGQIFVLVIVLIGTLGNFGFDFFLTTYRKLYRTMLRPKIVR
jgi:hypothetical protein